MSKPAVPEPGGHFQGEDYQHRSREGGSRRERCRRPRGAARTWELRRPLGLADCALVTPFVQVRDAAPLHDRGKVLVQVALMLAGGGESCADIEHLRCEAAPLRLIVPSDSTVHRAFHELAPELLRSRCRRRQSPRCDASVWERSAVTKGTRARCFSTSMPPSSRSTPRTKRARLPPTRGASASTPSSASPMPPARPSPGCCGRAMPVPTPSPITSVVLDAGARPAAGLAAGGPSAPATTASLVERPVVVRTDSAGSTAGFVDRPRRAQHRLSSPWRPRAARSRRPSWMRRRHRADLGAGARARTATLRDSVRGLRAHRSRRARTGL